MQPTRIRVSLSLLGAALALGLAACGGGAPSSTATPAGPVGDPAKGQTLFAGTCSACHGPDATGVTGLGKNLTTSAFVAAQTDAQLLAFVKTGRPVDDPANTTGVAMPPRGGNPALTDQDLADIISYVRTLHK